MNICSCVCMYRREKELYYAFKYGFMYYTYKTIYKVRLKNQMQIHEMYRVEAREETTGISFEMQIVNHPLNPIVSLPSRTAPLSNFFCHVRARSMTIKSFFRHCYENAHSWISFVYRVQKR